MKLRKLLCIGMAAICMLSVTGCNNGEKKPTEEEISDLVDRMNEADSFAEMKYTGKKTADYPYGYFYTGSSNYKQIKEMEAALWSPNKTLSELEGVDYYKVNLDGTGFVDYETVSEVLSLEFNEKAEIYICREICALGFLTVYNTKDKPVTIDNAMKNNCYSAKGLNVIPAKYIDKFIEHEADEIYVHDEAGEILKQVLIDWGYPTAVYTFDAYGDEKSQAYLVYETDNYTCYMNFDMVGNSTVINSNGIVVVGSGVTEIDFNGDGKVDIRDITNLFAGQIGDYEYHILK